jgi:threonylcarbamoyladenosine tRNA methylthiotransferase MtaB
VRALARLEGDFRIRLSSLEVNEVTRPLVDLVGEYPDRICPHFHICLQSGSDRILRRMRRRWAAHMFVDRCHEVRRQLSLPALTTDVIVGFPGETEADFADTCRVARDVGFSKIHVFPFSARQGTLAAEMPDQVSAEVKAQRSRQLAALERELRVDYFRQLVGKPLRVLVEAPLDGSPERLIGTSCRYAPVELEGSPSLCGTLIECTPHAADAGRLKA